MVLPTDMSCQLKSASIYLRYMCILDINMLVNSSDKSFLIGVNQITKKYHMIKIFALHGKRAYEKLH